jgi:O-antigen/teichoic acid export membrane protein
MGLPFKIAANTLYQLIGKLITAGITFLVTILIARQFGSTGFGEFTKITTYVAFFYLIVDFGQNAIVLKQISNLKTQKEI